MKSTKLITIAMLLALVINNIWAATTEEELFDDNNEEDYATYYEYLNAENAETTPSETEQQVSLRGTGRFLAQKPPRATQMTCNKNPRICRAKGSPGPDCCHKKCVNVKSDRANCGLCGKKCKYSEICCKGKCVNPKTDKKHCGGCNNKCKKGNVCVYGMCSYA